MIQVILSELQEFFLVIIVLQVREFSMVLIELQLAQVQELFQVIHEL